MAGGTTALVGDEIGEVVSVAVGAGLIGILCAFGAKYKNIPVKTPRSTAYPRSLRIIGHSHHRSLESGKIEPEPVYTHGWKKLQGWQKKAKHRSGSFGRSPYEGSVLFHEMPVMAFFPNPSPTTS